MTVATTIAALIAREGGFVDHPADRGGATIWGITEQVARAYGYTGAMRAMPQALARDIYERRYWREPGFDKVAAIFPKLAEELFDTGVNMGAEVPARFLQRSLNIFNREGKSYPDIAVDGRIGTMTIAALRAYRDTHDARAETVLIRAVDSQQGERYHQIAEGRESQEAFTYGWFAERIGALS